MGGNSPQGLPPTKKRVALSNKQTTPTVRGPNRVDQTKRVAISNFLNVIESPPVRTGTLQKKDAPREREVGTFVDITPKEKMPPKKGIDPAKTFLAAVAATAAIMGGMAVNKKSEVFVRIEQAPAAPTPAAVAPTVAIPSAVAPTVAIPSAVAPTVAIPSAVAIPQESLPIATTRKLSDEPRVPQALRDLNLGNTHQEAVASVFLSDKLEVPGDNISTLAIRHALRDHKLSPESLIAMYTLIDKTKLKFFIDVLSLSQKANILAWTNAYKELANYKLPANTVTIITESKKAINKKHQGEEYIGPRILSSYSDGRLTEIQARAYLFQSEYSAKIPDLIKYMTELQTMLLPPTAK